MVGDTILIKDISINGNNDVTGGLNTATADKLSKTLTDNTINALGIDASSRTIWINGQPYGNAYVNINEDTVEAPIGAEIFNDFENNIASGEYSHAEGKGTITSNAAEHASGKYNQSHKDTTLFSIGIGESKADRKNAIEVTQDGDIYVNSIGGYDGTNPSNSKDIATYLPNMVYIRYEDLKALRGNDQLVPGQQYRITNYTCTTSTAGTKPAGHKFDIIVTADSNNKLNEEARAINHYFDNLEDDYFKDCNLSAWKIWYCIDNNTNRFGWELGDKKYLGITYGDVTKYYEYASTQEIDGISYDLWRVSDSSSNSSFYGTTSTDLNASCDIIRYMDGSYSVQSQMRGTISDNTGAEGGKGVIYRMIDEFGNDCPYDFKNIQFYREQYENTGLYSIISNSANGTPCYTFSSYTLDQTSKFTDMSLSVSNNVYSNVIKEYISSNKQALNNTCFFGTNCYYNTLGNDCSCNTFRNTCKSNTFGNGCSYNVFGNDCYRNSFGNNCEYNFFGNGYRNNSFGDGCCYNSFRVSASISSSLKDQVCYNHFDDGCSYNVIWNSKTTSSALLKNINVNRGVVGTESSYNMINIDVLNSAQEINVNQFDRIVSIGNILSIKYESLKALKDSDQLIPGRQYRIIDYTCTTSTTGTKSAGNAFDIIVTADSNNKLNEEARAINHHFDNLEDDYFKDCNLYAWKIWYCIDNDINRFDWADATNGKGVIYRMIDEFGNDCPYDFKNIQFYRKQDTTTGLYSIISDATNGTPCYTFSSRILNPTDNFTDTSLSISNNVYSNVIKQCINFNIQQLNNNCFFGTNCYCNTFGNDCENNSFGDNCSNNIVGNDYDNNSFGESCSNNIFGNKCSNNTFGNYCSYNTFGNGCQYIKFASASSVSATKYNYYRYNHFGDGCQRILFIGKDTASDFDQVQNYNFSQGINYRGTSYKYINAELGLQYETRVLEPGATTAEIKEMQ